ncbi:multidrug effflux MFS transporter [Albirhodobacter sp. R86504]|uniref:multidrug effflux MFS transporter n=1 Tax=Albirhodobacter sp. R86504 TaxID=3093848 RepID=UPI003671AE99
MTSSPPSARKAAQITAVLGLLSIFPPLATDMYLAALGDIADAMHTTHAGAELSLSIFFLGLCVGQLVMGPMIDGFGRKRPLLIATAVFVGTSIALTMVDNIYIFNGLRFVQALGACGGMVVGRAVVNDLYEGKSAAKAMTLLVTLLTIGPIVSPTLGSLMLGGFGWQSIFMVMGLIGALALVLSMLLVPETLPAAHRVATPFATGATSAAALIRHRDFMLPAIITGCVQGGLFAFITGSSGVFQGVFGLGSVAYGLLFAGIATALLVSGKINTWLLNQYSPARILKDGLPIYVAVTSILVAVCAMQTLWLIVVPLWLAIGAVGVLSANSMHIAMASLRGVKNIGSGIGSALLGAVQFGLAFGVSSLVAMGGTGSPLPMALGLLGPALIGFGLSLRLAQPAPADGMGVNIGA